MMTEDKHSELLPLLQPDLLTQMQLVNLLEARCFKAPDLKSMSKERLVDLFRKLILPMPQRSYRDNRRGRLLKSRRAKYDQEPSNCTQEKKAGKRPLPDRLKPLPDSSTPNKILITSESERKGKRNQLDNIIINHKSNRRNEKSETVDRTKSEVAQSIKKVVLKRSSSSSGSDTVKNCSSEESKGIKKQRTAIKWP